MNGKNMRNRKPFLLLLVPILLGLLAAIVMFLWNAIVPEITGWKPVNFWQAAGLLLLCKILFGGIGHPSRFSSRTPLSRQKWRERLMNASPEEKQALKDAWRKHCNK